MLLNLRSLVETPANTASATYGVTVAQATGTVRVLTAIIFGGRAGYAEAVARKVVGDQRLRISGTGAATFAVTLAEGYQWADQDQIAEEEEFLMQLIAVALMGSDR